MEKYEETLICAHLDGHSSRLMAPLLARTQTLASRRTDAPPSTTYALHDPGDRRMWNWLRRRPMIAGHGLCHGVMRGRAAPWNDVCRRRCRWGGAARHWICEARLCCDVATWPCHHRRDPVGGNRKVTV
jgi:hypothetical protein